MSFFDTVRDRPPAPGPPYVVAGLGRAGHAAFAALRARHDCAQIACWDGGVAPGSAAGAERLRGAGARVVVGGDGTELLEATPPPRTLVASPGLPDDLPLLRAARARGLTVLDEAELGWRLDDRPWVAVTGTNGKTTTARLVEAALRAAGRRPLLAGNTWAGPPLSILGPDADVIVAEISSFQLERSEHLIPEAAVLTMLAGDHLDRHGTMEAYAAVKARLLHRDDAAVPIAAISVDDPWCREIAEQVRARGATVRTFGLAADADVRACAAEWDLDGATVLVRDADGAGHTVHTRLPGLHNAANVAAAFAIAGLLGLDAETTAGALADAIVPPGRFARLDVGSAPFDVVADFAKNSTGVHAALATARLVAAERGGRVVAVLSALPVAPPDDLVWMGRAAGAGADEVVVTVDRWTPDVPVDPPGDLLRGALSTNPRATQCGERPAALARALELARPGDIVCVLGRPPGAWPLIARDGSVCRFDDAAALRALVCA